MENNNSRKEKANRFEQVFEVEVDGWCVGLTQFPGEVNSTTVYLVLRELKPIIREAVRNHYSFNIIDLALRLSKAAKYLVPEREISMGILTLVPNPAFYDDHGKRIIYDLVNQVEHAYGGVAEKMKRRWQTELEYIQNTKTKLSA